MGSLQVAVSPTKLSALEHKLKQRKTYLLAERVKEKTKTAPTAGFPSTPTLQQRRFRIQAFFLRLEASEIHDGSSRSSVWLRQLPHSLPGESQVDRMPSTAHLMESHVPAIHATDPAGALGPGTSVPPQLPTRKTGPASAFSSATVRKVEVYLHDVCMSKTECMCVLYVCCVHVCVRERKKDRQRAPAI